MVANLEHLCNRMTHKELRRTATIQIGRSGTSERLEHVRHLLIGKACGTERPASVSRKEIHDAVIRISNSGTRVSCNPFSSREMTVLQKDQTCARTFLQTGFHLLVFRTLRNHHLVVETDTYETQGLLLDIRVIIPC